MSKLKTWKPEGCSVELITFGRGPTAPFYWWPGFWLCLYTIAPCRSLSLHLSYPLSSFSTPTQSYLHLVPRLRRRLLLPFWVNTLLYQSFFLDSSRTRIFLFSLQPPSFYRLFLQATFSSNTAWKRRRRRTTRRVWGWNGKPGREKFLIQINFPASFFFLHFLSPSAP